MIRIDLGSGEGRKKGDSLRRVAIRLKLQQPYDELLQKFDNDVSRLIAFFVSVALAFLPFLLEGEYERIVRDGFAAKTAAIQRETAGVEEEIKKLLPYKQELETYERQKTEVLQKLNTIRQLIDTRGTPVVALDAVGQALPEGVWLDSTSFDAGTGSEKIVLHGHALTNEDISDYVDHLSQSTSLKNIRINSVESSTSMGMEIRTFSIDLESNPAMVRQVTAEGSK